MKKTAEQIAENVLVKVGLGPGGMFNLQAPNLQNLQYDPIEARDKNRSRLNAANTANFVKRDYESGAAFQRGLKYQFENRKPGVDWLSGGPERDSSGRITAAGRARFAPPAPGGAQAATPAGGAYAGVDLSGASEDIKASPRRHRSSATAMHKAVGPMRGGYKFAPQSADKPLKGMEMGWLSGGPIKSPKPGGKKQQPSAGNEGALARGGASAAPSRGPMRQGYNWGGSDLGWAFGNQKPTARGGAPAQQARGPMRQGYGWGGSDLGWAFGKQRSAGGAGGGGALAKRQKSRVINPYDQPAQPTGRQIQITDLATNQVQRYPSNA